MTKIARNNHYVPQNYLKNWSDTPDKVWRYRLLVTNEKVPLWDNPSIVNSGSQLDLYTFNDGESESDEFEKWFDREVECPASKVISKVVSEISLTKHDYNVLAKYLAAQFVRTPARLHNQLTFYKNRLSSTIDLTLKRSITELEESISIGKPICRKPINDNDKFIPAKVSIIKNPDNDDGQLKYEALLGRGVWLFEVRHVVENTSKVLMNHHWQIIKSAPGASWCTSDDPVICLNYYGNKSYDFGGGWGKLNSEIMMPLSPKYLLYTKVGSSRDDLELQENPAFTFMIQKFIFEHAYRNIYSMKPFDSIASCIRRIVNKEIFDHEKEQWSKWYAEQSAAEKALKVE